MDGKLRYTLSAERCRLPLKRYTLNAVFNTLHAVRYPLYAVMCMGRIYRLEKSMVSLMVSTELICQFS